MAGELGYSTQMMSSFQGAQEMGIVSRIPAKRIVSGAEQFHATFDAKTPPRGFVYLLLEQEERDLLIYSCHLKSNRGGSVSATARIREESARQLLQHIQIMEKDGRKAEKPLWILVMGDFNYDPFREEWAEDKTLEIFLDGGFASGFAGRKREDAVTWISDGTYGDGTFDHILIKGFTLGETAEVIVEDTDGSISDHRPVWIDIED